MRPVQITQFVARHVPHRRIDDICFGSPKNYYHRDRRQNHVVHEFNPGQLFGVLWWRRYRDDRQHRTLAIVQALERGELGCRLLGIRQWVTVHAIVDQHGPAGQDGAVDQLLELIEVWKSRGHQPERLPPSYWTRASHHILLDTGWLNSRAGQERLCAT